MKSDIRQISMIFLLIALSLTAGCDSIQPLELAGKITRKSFVTVTDAGSLVFELLSSKNLIITDLTADYDDGEFVIKGRIKRSVNFCCKTVTGHIDVAVFSPDSYLTEAFSTRFNPVFIPRTGTKSSSFEVRLGKEVIKGSSVKIAYHNTTTFIDFDSENVKLDCGENAALLTSRSGNIKTLKIGSLE